MRVRKKDWASQELKDSNFVIINALKNKGVWHEEFRNSNPIYLELGCGTGKFISQSAEENPCINYIGIDIKNEILVLAKRTIEETVYSKMDYVENIRLTPIQINFIDDFFAKDEISRIYINFCNPWPKPRQNKRRLTNTEFLEKYKDILKPNSEIWFKTDDKSLFMDSLEYFKSEGFVIKYKSYDLHKSEFENNVMTEYEERFTQANMPIMFLIAGSN